MFSPAPPAVVATPAAPVPPPVVAPPAVVMARAEPEVPANVVIAPAEPGLPERPIFASPNPSLLASPAAPPVAPIEPPRVGGETFGPTGTVVGTGLSAVSAPGFAAAAAAADAHAASTNAEPDSPWLRTPAPAATAPEYRPPEPAREPEPTVVAPKAAQGGGGNTAIIVVVAVVVLGLAGAGFAFRKDLAGAFGSSSTPNDKPVQLDSKTSTGSPTPTQQPSAALPPPLPSAIPAPETAVPKQTPPSNPQGQQGGTPTVRPPATVKTEPKFTPTEL